MLNTTVKRSNAFGSAAFTATVVLAALCSQAASAQGVYRIVGPDGKVTYSDQPPPAAANARPVTGTAKSQATANADLPAPIRSAVTRYPVTFYTTTECGPCDKGRSFLNSRGIPFVEKTVTTNDDLAALKRLAGDGGLPLLTIGGQQLKGYSEVEWTQYLDAAGYPKTASLPASYRRPAATPLVEARSAPESATAQARAPKAPAEQAPAEVPITAPVTNPGGIRF